MVQNFTQQKKNKNSNTVTAHSWEEKSETARRKALRKNHLHQRQRIYTANHFNGRNYKFIKISFEAKGLNLVIAKEKDQIDPIIVI